MTEPTSVEPKHSHYVSLENGCIHPALTSPVGYEDEHTTEWRPATPQEIQRYLAGADRTDAYGKPEHLHADADRAAIATPTTLTLADEENVGVELTAPPPSAVQPAPLAQPAPAPAPAPPPPLSITQPEK